MKNLSMIACVSQDRGLGNSNDLLWRFTADQKFFRDTTMGASVVMGSNTFASIGKVLPGRKNIVLTRGEINDSAVQVFHDTTSLNSYLETLSGEKFIIGGASLYQLYLPEAETLYLTEVSATKPADVFFPEFDRSKYQSEILQTGEFDGIKYSMIKYSKKEV